MASHCCTVVSGRTHLVPPASLPPSQNLCLHFFMRTPGKYDCKARSGTFPTSFPLPRPPSYGVSCASEDVSLQVPCSFRAVRVKCCRDYGNDPQVPAGEGSLPFDPIWALGPGSPSAHLTAAVGWPCSPGPRTVSPLDPPSWPGPPPPPAARRPARAGRRRSYGIAAVTPGPPPLPSVVIALASVVAPSWSSSPSLRMVAVISCSRYGLSA